MVSLYYREMRVLDEREKKKAHNFEKLALHFISPAFRLHFFSDTENLFNCARDHSYSFFGLGYNRQVRR